ncbi:Rrf2 family transcriptional regulator [Micromonospora sp. DH15]|nr:Rrf2 family transcriptional regulator [Micromonospora sp. DH15]
MPIPSLFGGPPGTRRTRALPIGNVARPPKEITIGAILRAVDGPLAGVRGMRPEETSYDGAAENLPRLWVAVRAAVRQVVDEVSLAEMASGRLPGHVRRLIARPDAWEPR